MGDLRILIALTILTSWAISSCTWQQTKVAMPKAKSPPIQTVPKGPDNQAMVRVRSLDPDASIQDLQMSILNIVTDVKAARPSDKPMILEAIGALAEHPNAAEALQAQYQAMPSRATRDRHFMLAIVGQMRSDKNLQFLEQIVWAPLPAHSERADQADGLSERRQEEVVRMKAIHGIGFLRSPEAYSALRKIMMEHESAFLRTIAIDTYLWNQQDSPKIAAELRQVLPAEYRDYVDIPRFTKETSPIELQHQIDVRQGKSRDRE